MLKYQVRYLHLLIKWNASKSIFMFSFCIIQQASARIFQPAVKIERIIYEKNLSARLSLSYYCCLNSIFVRNFMALWLFFINCTCFKIRHRLQEKYTAEHADTRIWLLIWFQDYFLHYFIFILKYATDYYNFQHPFE